jgi:hypothetical protein
MRWSEVVSYFETLVASRTVEPKDRDDLDKALAMARGYAAKEGAP